MLCSMCGLHPGPHCCSLSGSVHSAGHAAAGCGGTVWQCCQGRADRDQAGFHCRRLGRAESQLCRLQDQGPCHPQGGQYMQSNGCARHKCHSICTHSTSTLLDKPPRSLDVYLQRSSCWLQQHPAGSEPVFPVQASDTAELVEKLEDSQMTLGSMASNRYSTPFR